MLLIIFLGLIVNFTLVYGECKVGTQDVKNFDWSKFSGPRPWYFRLHTPNTIDNDFDCPVSICAAPEGNVSLITFDSYVISQQSHITIYGNATNWHQTGYWDEIYGEPASVTVRVYVIAVDYDRYVILSACTVQPDKPYVYVGYRSQHPDEATEKDVLEELKKNKIDVCQLMEYKTDHCKKGQ